MTLIITPKTSLVLAVGTIEQMLDMGGVKVVMALPGGGRVLGIVEDRRQVGAVLKKAFEMMRGGEIR